MNRAQCRNQSELMLLQRGDTMELETVEDIHENLRNGNIKDAVDMIKEEPDQFFRAYDLWLEFYSHRRHDEFVRATLAYFGVVR